MVSVDEGAGRRAAGCALRRTCCTSSPASSPSTPAWPRCSNRCPPALMCLSTPFWSTPARRQTSADSCPARSSPWRRPRRPQDVAVALAERLGLSLFRLRAADLPATPRSRTRSPACGSAMPCCSTVRCCSRRGGRPCGDGRALRWPQQGVRRSDLHCWTRPAFADAEAFAVNHPDAPAQCRLWRQALAARHPPRPTAAFDALASHYRLSARRIAALAERSAAMPR